MLMDLGGELCERPAIDRREFVAAFRTERTKLHGIARSVVGEESAADVVQDTFVRVWSQGDRYDQSRGTWSQYLCTVTRGVAIDHVRSSTRQRARDERNGADRDDVMAEEPTRRLIDHETAQRVRAALMSLPDVERVAITMAFYDGFSYRDVASRLGLPEGTVKSRIRSGLVHLRSLLVD